MLRIEILGLRLKAHYCHIKFLKKGKGCLKWAFDLIWSSDLFVTNVTDRNLGTAIESPLCVIRSSLSRLDSADHTTYSYNLLTERALLNPLQMDTKDKVRFKKGKGVFKMGFWSDLIWSSDLFVTNVTDRNLGTAIESPLLSYKVFRGLGKLREVVEDTSELVSKSLAPLII